MSAMSWTRSRSLPKVVLAALAATSLLLLPAAHAAIGANFSAAPEQPSAADSTPPALSAVEDAALAGLLAGPLAGPGNATLDAALEAALGKALLSLTRPEMLRQHVQGVVQDETYAHLRAGAADCDLSLAHWFAALGHLEPWALQMVDASSKLVTGILYGNLADLGNFDECVASGPGLGPGGATPDDDPVDGSGGFAGRYALFTLDVQTAAQPSAQQQRRQRKLLQAMAVVKQRSARKLEADAQYSTLVSLRVSLCVPSTCQAPLLEAAMRAALDNVNELAALAGVRLKARLPEEYTSLAGPWRKLDIGDWIVIMLCVALVLLALVATAVDVVLEHKGAARQTRQRLGILLAFSAWSNGRRLLQVAPPSDSNFTCINGIRFLSAMWVILGHRYRYALDVPFMNLITIPKRVSDTSIMVIANAPLSVDTFFLIGGLVNCYAFMKSTHTRRSFSFLQYYVHRYIRLTPAFALVVGVTATWLTLLGSGPLWRQVGADAGESCRRNWWTALLYVANYANPQDQCMMQSWYLMVDMQLHWLSPLLLVPLWRWRRLGLGWAGVVLVASCAIPFVISYVNDFRSPISTDLNVDAQRFFMQNMYYVTHTRFTSYVCGTLAGYMLYLIKTGQLRVRLSNAQVAFGWLGSSVLCMTVVFGAQPLFDKEHHAFDAWESSAYIGLYRLGWSAGLTWVVLACILGRGGPVNAFLSWTPFTVLGRLTYGIYLTHAAVQIVDVGTMRTSEYYSDFKMVERMFSDTVIATVLGACLCLTMESPISAIEKSFRGGRRPRTAAANGEVQPGLKGLQSLQGRANAAFVADDGIRDEEAVKQPIPATNSEAVAP